MSINANIMLVVGDFYPDISELLIDGAVSRLKAYSTQIKHEVIRVNGALEVPAALSFAILSDRESHDGYIALGCILKGATAHNDYAASTVFSSISDIAAHHAVPLGNGIITADSRELALERANKNQKDVGGRAASAMLTMLELYKRFLG